MDRQKKLEMSIDKLSREFSQLDLTFHKMEEGNADDITSYWPGQEDEDIMVCVFKGNKIHEPFHRQDFFFINFAYQNSYEALSAKYDRLITIHEGDTYIGQPYSGYALRGKNDKTIIIIGVLIRRDSFFRNFLPIIYADTSLFHFFIEPVSNRFSDEYIHLTTVNRHVIRILFELMIIEYADRKEDTQRFLKSLLQTLMLEIAREYANEKMTVSSRSISEQILDYMDSHSNVVTLKDISAHFSYHPNYISTVLHKETGRKFTDILLEKRMERAKLLIRNTTLSIEEISNMVGYSNFSNFYKSYKKYFGHTPRLQNPRLSF